MLSTLNTYTFKLLKFLVPLLRHQISKDFTLKVNFEFVKIICEKDADLFMASLDINSPFMKSSIFVWISYSKVIVAFMALTKKQIMRSYVIIKLND